MHLRSCLWKFLKLHGQPKGHRGQYRKYQGIDRNEVARRPKDVQCLTGRMVALIRFVSKATDKCLPFFKILKGGNVKARHLGELSQFDIVFKPRTAIKEQALVDFVVVFANTSEVDTFMTPLEPPT
ncbi:Uncharacterized protein Adt_33277 [Abeliophyllum distichum]|uniref:Uncharacterized protein n=1 Tax=Abeliophyllum distichum TaxID=126358 RepID=A0ABD1QYE7_9LAMI